MVRAGTGGGELSNADHLTILSKDKRDGKKARDVAYKSILKGLVISLQGTNKYLLLRARSTGAWLSVRGTAVSGTVLSST